MDFELVAIDAGVEVLDLPHHLRCSANERIEGEPHHAFAPRAHREQLRLQLAKLGLEVAAAVRGG